MFDYAKDSQQLLSVLTKLKENFQSCVSAGSIRTFDWTYAAEPDNSGDLNFDENGNLFMINVICYKPLDFMIKAAIQHDARPLPVKFTIYTNSEDSYK